MSGTSDIIRTHNGAIYGGVAKRDSSQIGLAQIGPPQIGSNAFLVEIKPKLVEAKYFFQFVFVHCCFLQPKAK